MATAKQPPSVAICTQGVAQTRLAVYCFACRRSSIHTIRAAVLRVNGSLARISPVGMGKLPPLACPHCQSRQGYVLERL